MTKSGIDRFIVSLLALAPALLAALLVLAAASNASANVISAENETLAPQGEVGSVDLFDFVYTDGGSIAISVEGYNGSASGSFDPLVLLLDDAGAIIGANNNGGDGANPLLAGTLGAGDYTVAVLRYTPGASLADYQAAVDSAVATRTAWRGSSVGVYDLTISASGTVAFGSTPPGPAVVPELSASGLSSVLLFLGGTLLLGAGGRGRAKGARLNQGHHQSLRA